MTQNSSISKMQMPAKEDNEKNVSDSLRRTYLGFARFLIVNDGATVLFPSFLWQKIHRRPLKDNFSGTQDIYRMMWMCFSLSSASPSDIGDACPAL